MTAAHCFFQVNKDILDDFTLRNLRDAYQQTRVSGPFVISITSIPGATGLATDVYLHPSWDQDDPDWFEDNDIALVRVGRYIPVPLASGSIATEFRRLIYVGSDNYLDDLEAERGFMSRIAFCGFGLGSTTSLACGLATNAETREGHIEIDGSRWIGRTCRLECGDDDNSGGSKFQPGDSGGPLFVHNPRLCAIGSAPQNDNRRVAELMAQNGVIVGVVSGPDVKKFARRILRLPGYALSTGVFSALAALPASLELDSMAGGTFGQRSWIESIPGTNDLILVGNNECYNRASAQELWELAAARSLSVSLPAVMHALR
ncbi:hypothetical protein SLH49_12460 [Cognatiyoonia sp. IB215446]|uniref:hypothetical protein n=1 Tax=Cognatiyoonia sp. IB215446 TaxID=3097355 RepID=UPI002A0BB3BD|nr:hypothetical protein [Cognatiyoonia sp. IB215446]MDX8348794.1 hypothetical protein [Cognatiyoonia sp. IB215446]